MELKLLLSLLFGAVGAFDSIALVLGNRAAFRSARFALAWAMSNGAAHCVMKAAGASLGPIAAALWLRGLVFAVSAFVLKQALSHLRHHHKPKARWELWLPAIALGSLDALPLSFTKGLVVNQSIAGLLISTSVVVALPFLASQLWRWRHLRRGTRTACLARLAHFSIFCWIAPFVAVEQFLPLDQALAASFLVAVALLCTLGIPAVRKQLRAARES